jgi:hypothetical protein
VDGDLRPSTLAKYCDLLERHVTQPTRDDEGNVVRFTGLGKKRLDEIKLGYRAALQPYPQDRQ